MNAQQYADAHSPAVQGIPTSGDPEQDHLIDEIQHPDLYDALHDLAERCGGVAAGDEREHG
ncbi:hypothetical protein [Streptacidiphilus sp. EB129]|uniref:hypothetical protein n=1 Tax=Streptacidiphilus sp. EB129 TaxID=3156262 RepID=UPI003515478F